MPSDILILSVDRTQNIPIIIGNTASFTLSIKNVSPSFRLYNMNLYLTLPDGLTLTSATLPQTSTVTNANNSISYSWINLKDLAPMEVDYIFQFTIKCNNTFKSGTTIPFGYIFSGINISCVMDTKPRGNYDIGNEKVTNEVLMTFKAIRFYGTISTAGKVLKGAGTSISLNDYTQIHNATCKFSNNSISTSTVNISILLDNGIRYLDNITATGTDASQFTSPIVSTVTIDNKQYIQIYYSAITLSVNSNTTISFKYAVWNKYDNNQGNLIGHKTKLNMYINMNSSDDTVNNNTSFSAMDFIISTSINKSVVDVQDSVQYTYVYSVGQYYDIQDIIVNYLLPDGISYLSSSTAPTTVIDNSILQGFYLTYNFPFGNKNSTNTVTINAKVDDYYRYKFDENLLPLPVVSYDGFIATTDITGTTVELLNAVTDNSSVSSRINVATVKKEFLKGYYRDGSAKIINALSPGDLAEYKLTYDASTLKAIQKQIYIDDFFPLSADPIDNLSYSYSGYPPSMLTPQLIDPHGVDFNYGNIPGNSFSTIIFKVPIKTLGGSGQNNNLMKLKGINTYGNSYSNRDQVTINISSPNLQLTKSVTGPNKNAIKANEVYTYTVKITNTNTLGTETDAFDFILTDALSSWFSINLTSIQVSGSGSYNAPEIVGNNISLYINKLSPGQSLTLTYSVIIANNIAPGVSIATAATNTNPYSQVYNSNLDNFQYTNLNKSASVTISSASISLTKTNVADTLKVNSFVTYNISVIIPQGTIAYGLYIKDTLPSGGQIYVGPSYRNGIEITPAISSNIITFPTEGSIDARISAQTITYVFKCKITNANKGVGSITSTQTDTAQCLYQKIEDGSYSTVSKNLTVTVNHPNLVMNLSMTDKTTSIIYTQNANININSVLEFKLIFQNNSSINLVNGTIEIPIDNNFLFVSINNTQFCTTTYNETSKKIIISIAKLDASISGFITFTLLPLSNLKSGTSVNIQAMAISYYNDIAPTKVYGGEKSNTIICVLPPETSLLPNPTTMIDEFTSFVVTPPGNTAIILNYFKNTGGGYDDYNITIQPVRIEYTLYIDDVEIATILPNTLYSADLDIMKNLAPLTSRIIKLTAIIPIDQPLGSRYDFVVTAKSKTSPYPEKTVLNIDPY